MLKSDKISSLPPYLFAQIDQTVHKLTEQGEDILALSKSDPDYPTPSLIVEELVRSSRDAQNHHYPSFDGLRELRQAVANWYDYRFGVYLDPENEVLPLLGSKEGLVHICQALIGPGQGGLVPDPCFPAYRTGVILAGGAVISMPLLPENNYLPVLADIHPSDANKADLMFLNYPNNPTGAIAPFGFYEEIVSFAKKYNIIVCHDNAYSETTFDGYEAGSFLQTPGAKDTGVEFFTFSKAFNMAGWRLGFVAGNKEVINALKTVETHINAGIFYPIQYAGAMALNQVARSDFFEKMNDIYLQRRDKVVAVFNQMGWKLKKPSATVYIWLPVLDNNYNSESFTKLLLDKAKVAVSPGIGFGERGEGYVRICLTYPDEVIEKALRNIQSVFSHHLSR